MKILILIACHFVGGCVGNALEHKTYDADGNLLSVTEVKNLNGFVNTETGCLMFGITDGQFKVVVVMFDRKLEDSPESAKVIFDGVVNLLTGGASNVVNNLTEGK